MSKKSEEKYRRTKEYFREMDKTAKAVSEFSKTFINKRFKIHSQLKELILTRYAKAKIKLRSTQIRLAYELVGGNKWEEIIPACAAVSMKETAYYCLDDIFDVDLDPKKVPLLGFPFLSTSYRMITELGNSFSKEQQNRVQEELYTLDELNYQAFMIEQELQRGQEEKYMQKVEGYNFWEQTLKIGAILGNANESEISQLGEIGKHFGMGIIIANDTWDFGKELEDFRNSRYTLPINRLFQTASSKDKQKLENLIGKKQLSAEEKEYIRKLAVQNKVISYGKQKAWSYCEQGLLKLQAFPDSQAKRMFEIPLQMTQQNKYFHTLTIYE